MMKEDFPHDIRLIRNSMGSNGSSYVDICMCMKVKKDTTAQEILEEKSIMMCRLPEGYEETYIHIELRLVTKDVKS